ncbi:hypothetical protein, partial [Ligilactobacillus equi]
FSMDDEKDVVYSMMGGIIIMLHLRDACKSRGLENLFDKISDAEILEYFDKQAIQTNKPFEEVVQHEIDNQFKNFLDQYDANTMTK